MLKVIFQSLAICTSIQVANVYGQTSADANQIPDCSQNVITLLQDTNAAQVTYVVDSGRKVLVSVDELITMSEPQCGPLAVVFQQREAKTDALWTDIDGLFQPELDQAGETTGISLDLTTDAYIMAGTAGGALKSDNDGVGELEIRVTVFDPEFKETVTLSKEFLLKITGQPNVCKDVTVEARIAECERFGQEPCPNEKIYLSKDLLTFEDEGLDLRSNSRKLFLNKLSNWWSYVTVDGSQVDRAREIAWARKGSDGETLCPLEWEPVLQTSPNAFQALEDSSLLSVLLEEVDYERNYIQIGWSKVTDDILEELFDPEKRRYELTLGFRVWNRWQQPTPQASFLLFDMILETEETSCTSFEPIFEISSREETFYALDSLSKFQVTFSVADLNEEPPCETESLFQVWDVQNETWIRVTDLDTSLITDVASFGAVINLTLADLEQLPWFDSVSGVAKWRLVIFDPEYAEYAPSLATLDPS